MTVETIATRRLTTLEQAIIECVVYSDVFDFAVTPAEIHSALPIKSTLAEVESALASEQLEGELLTRIHPYVMLCGREDLVLIRERRAQSSLRLRRRAERYGRLIARLPFVRMVALTGSLAVESAEAGDDIDYLIVTAPGRVWLTRALTMVVVRVAALRGVTLCPNYLLSESALTLPDRDYYTARELLQMAPLAGGDVYAKMLAANAWWRDYLPNAQPSADIEPVSRSWLTAAAEALLRTPAGTWLDRALLRRKGDELRRQAPGNVEVVFDETMCKGHFEGHRERTQARIAERLQSLGVKSP
jgi:hypothetical protein